LKELGFLGNLEAGTFDDFVEFSGAQTTSRINVFLKNT
jgi:hypothetical protein